MPFSGLSVDFLLESADGFHRLDAGIDGRAEWSGPGEWELLLAARARYELVFAALNDHPLSLYLDVGYERQEGLTVARAARDSLAGGAGLLYSFQL